MAGEPAQKCAERLAREKALKVWRNRPQEIVLGADTVVVVDDVILGKPTDVQDAVRMLRLLSGRQHQVITGVCLVRSAGRGTHQDEWEAATAEIRTAAETTLVTMSAFSDDEIRDYVATGEPKDKAGAYAIQGIASRWIPRIEGDYSNVVGLPIALVYRMLKSGRFE